MYSRFIAATFLVALLTNSASAVFTWTGGAGAGSDWYDAGNWDGGLVPNQSDSNSPTSTQYAVGSESATDLVIWDSETAVGGYMPTATLTNGNDWFGDGWHLAPGTHVKNGTINYGTVNNSWWGAGHNLIDLEVGDGDMGTEAVVNMGWKEVNRFLKDSSNGLVIKVNADGTVNQLTDLNYRFEQTWPTTVQLNGGKWIVNGNVTELATGGNNATRTFSFDAAGAMFTAQFGGDFVDIAAVTAQIGDSFVDTTGLGLVATDNLDSTFTVTTDTGVAPLAGDLDADDMVGQSDLDLVLLNWGSAAAWPGEPQPGATVGQPELDAVLLNWGSSQLAGLSSANVPEPSAIATLVCLAVGGFVFGRKKQ